MPRAVANGIEIEYEVYGELEDPVVLLVNGLGSQLLSWDLDFVQGLVDRGFCAIRFDNRDVGLSTKIETGFDAGAAILAAFSGDTTEVDAPYHLLDMAADAVSVLDDLDIEAAHVVGVSMGGMIAQSIAIAHPERVLTLTSIMSTTGDPDVGQPKPEILGVLIEPSPTEREAYIAHSVEGSRAIGSPELFEEDRYRARAAAGFDRSFYPAGTPRQLVAVATSGSRSDALANVSVPTLVIHGDADPLVTLSGGQRTAEVIPGAELLVLEGMGHDLPSVYWPTIIEHITQLAARSAMAS